MENWTEDVGLDPPWEEKPFDKLLWRGKNTGIFHKPGVPWGELPNSPLTLSLLIRKALIDEEISQRMNLVSRTMTMKGQIPVLPLTPLHKPVGTPHNVPLAELNSELMDVAFVNEPIQCDPTECARIKKEYKYGERKDWQSSNDYKYVLDIGMSFTFHIMLWWNSPRTVTKLTLM